MTAKRHSFKHNDAARLIRATKAAGCNIKGVTLRDGTVRVEVDDNASTAPAADTNPLDRVLDHAQDEKRTA